MRNLDVLLAHLPRRGGPRRRRAGGGLGELLAGRSGEKRTLEDSDRYLALLEQVEAAAAPHSPEHDVGLEDGVEAAGASPAPQGGGKRLGGRAGERQLARGAGEGEARALRGRAGRPARGEGGEVLQDVLGERQDAVVAEERLRELAAAASRRVALAAGRLIERQRPHRPGGAAGWAGTRGSGSRDNVIRAAGRVHACARGRRVRGPATCTHSGDNLEFPEQQNESLIIRRGVALREVAEEARLELQLVRKLPSTSMQGPMQTRAVLARPIRAANQAPRTRWKHVGGRAATRELDT